MKKVLKLYSDKDKLMMNIIKKQQTIANLIIKLEYKKMYIYLRGSELKNDAEDFYFEERHPDE